MAIIAEWDNKITYDGGRRATISFGNKQHTFSSDYITCAISAFTRNPSNEKVRGWLKTKTEDELVDIFKEAFNTLCHADGKARCCFLIFTNTLHGGEEFNKILNKVCKYSSTPLKNGNTGNMVKTWTFERYEK